MQLGSEGSSKYRHGHLGTDIFHVYNEMRLMCTGAGKVGWWYTEIVIGRGRTAQTSKPIIMSKGPFIVNIQPCLKLIIKGILLKLK